MISRLLAPIKIKMDLLIRSLAPAKWIILSLLFIIFFIFVVYVFLFYPGLMNQDSYFILFEARTGLFENWFSPLMAAGWSFLDLIYPSPAVIMIFHLIMIITGLTLFVFLAFPKVRPLNLLIFLIFIVPPVFLAFGHILKEPGLCGGMVLATALTLCFKKKRSKTFYFLAIITIFYVCAVRREAIFAEIPLIYWLMFLRIRTEKEPSLPKTRKVLCLCILTIIILIGIITAFNRLVIFVNHSPESQVILLDLAALSRETGQVLIPQTHLVNAQAKIEDFEPGLRERDITPLLNTVVLCPGKLAAQQALFLIWIKEIVKHPILYLKFRGNVFLALNGWYSVPINTPFLIKTQTNQFGFELAFPRFYEILFRLMTLLRDTWLFRGWVYLLLMVFGFIFYLGFPFVRSELPLLMLTSAFSHTIGLFYFSPTSQFRLMWWVVLATSLAIIMMFINGYYFLEKTRLSSNSPHR